MHLLRCALTELYCIQRKCRRSVQHLPCCGTSLHWYYTTVARAHAREKGTTLGRKKNRANFSCARFLYSCTIQLYIQLYCTVWYSCIRFIYLIGYCISEYSCPSLPFFVILQICITVRDGVLEIGFWDARPDARLDFLSGLRNRAIARLDFLSVTALPPLEKLRALLVF